MPESASNARVAFESILDDARVAAAGGVIADVHRAMREPAEVSVEAAFVAACDEVLTEYLVNALPGPELMQFLTVWPLRFLAPTTLLAWLQAHSRCTSWWSVREAEALVAFAGSAVQRQTFEVRGQEVVLEDIARDEVAAAMRWTSNFAATRIEEARLLLGSLPATKAAVESGEISPAHARVVVESAKRFAATTEVGSPAFAGACVELERRVLPVAIKHGIGQVRTAANKAVSVIDPAGRGARRDSAFRTRGVWLRDEPDGVATLIARMATEHAYACYAAVEKLAAAGRIDDQPFCNERTSMGERRSLALLHLTVGSGRDIFRRVDGGALSGADVNGADLGLADMPLPAVRTHVDVIVDLPTLLGLQDNDGEIVGGGELAGDTIRALVAHDTTATMRRLVTDPLSGHLLDIGRKRYVIPDALREFIVLRDQRCRFPGCHSPAATAEIDHATPWDAGGTSDRANLGALCKRHHQVKTLGGWTIGDSAEDGSCRWVSPAGNVYEHHAVAVDTDRLLVDETHARCASALSGEAGVPLPHGDVRETRDLVNDDP